VNFDLTDEQQMLQAAARDMLASRLTSEKRRQIAEADDAFDEALWNEMVELNWPGLLVSEEDGGQGLGTVELVVLMEQAGYALVPGPLFSNTLAALALEPAASDEQRERWLAPLARGEKRGTLALWDAGGGWRPDDVRMDPERSNGGWTLGGEKLFVLDAARADFFIVGARDGQCFIVDRDTPGISISETQTMDSTRRQYAVRFDGVEVDEAASFDASEHPLAADRMFTALAAELTGVAQRTLEMAVDYAKERKQFGRPIGAYQAVSHACAQMLLETEGARSAVYYAAWAADHEPQTAAVASSVAKAYASDAGPRVTGASLQVHGGIGFTWEHDLHLWLKRARCMAAYLGGSRWHRERVAALVLDRRDTLASQASAATAVAAS
jgi:alkylation response protein AidB-like acyl-CoA dehydrogenase